MAVGPQVLHVRVVGPLVRQIERSRDRTAVGVLATLLEHFLVQPAVDLAHGVVEGEQYELRNFLGKQAA